MCCFLLNKVVESWVIHGTDYFDPVEVAGPHEEVLVPLPKSEATTDAARKAAQSIINKCNDLFQHVNKAPIKERVVQHLIETGNATRVSQTVRKMSPLLMEDLCKKLDELIKNGLIQLSVSAWSSPVLFARNALGKLSFCGDYCAVNSLTKRDHHPLPLIQDCFDQLQGAVVFSEFYLQQGFHQMKITSEHMEKTAFSTRYGHYEWLVMPFDLVNSPSTFQRMMSDIL